MTEPLFFLAGLLLLALVPFVAMMVTSYTKIVIVLSLVRNAIGTQQVPPNMVINGLALVFSIYVMSPIIEDTYALVKVENVDFKNADADTLAQLLVKAKGPIKKFLLKYASDSERVFFAKSIDRIYEDREKKYSTDDLMVLIPAFTVSELTRAFQIGFLLFLPFIAIDIIVSNILLSLGMMMVSPITISLPFKLLLFVVANGWTRTVHGLILTYA